jgi:cell division protein FtsW
MEPRQKQKRPIFYKHRPDYVITALVAILAGLGLILIFSTGWISVLKRTSGASDTNYYFIRQLIGLIVGGVAWFVASRIDYRKWQKIATPLFIVTFLMMFLVLIPGVGVSSGGATRWVKLWFINFQPVEFLKLGAVIYMATWLTKDKEKLKKPLESLLPFLFIIGLIVAATIILQKDMGSAMVIILTMLAMYLVSGVPLWNFGSATLLLFGSGVALIALAPYRLARFLTFLDHTDDVSGAGYHINQALIALGSGGVIGRGIGKSLQAYGYLPEATNDSIFAIIGEETGLWGAFALVAVFVALIWRGMRVSRSAPDDFGRLLALGIICWIGFQALINISAMLGILPLTGIPLPFISYGGTSLVALLGAVGILQNISKYTYKEVYDEDFGSRGRDRRSHIAGTGRNSVNTQAR